MASVLEQIRKLDEQKAALLEGARKEALDKANAAIAELNELGGSYRLLEGGGGVDVGSGRSTRSTGTGTRRTGIRDQVLQAIQGTEGINRKDLLEAMGGKGDKSAEQSISNALSALKKAGTIRQDGGLYKAA